MGNIRFQRLFNRNERAVIVAMDHCLFEGPLEGMTNLAETASRVAPCVDGVLLSPGMLPYCQHAFNYKGAPMAVVRLNWSTTYCTTRNYREAATVTAFSPAEALRLGADVALVSLTLETGSEATDAHNVAVFRELCGAAKELGMPVVGEYFPVAGETLPPDQLHRKGIRGSTDHRRTGSGPDQDFLHPRLSRRHRELVRCPSWDWARPSCRLNWKPCSWPPPKWPPARAAWCSAATPSRFLTRSRSSRPCATWSSAASLPRKPSASTSST